MSSKSEETSIEVLKNVTEILLKNLIVNLDDQNANNNIYAYIYGDIINYKKNENNDFHYQIKTQSKRIVLKSVKFSYDSNNRKLKDENLLALAFFNNSLQNQDIYYKYRKNNNNLIMLTIEYDSSMMIDIPTNRILMNFYEESDDSLIPINNINFLNFKETVYSIKGLNVNSYTVNNQTNSLLKVIEKDLEHKQSEIVNIIEKTDNSEFIRIKNEYNKNINELGKLLEQL